MGSLEGDEEVEMGSFWGLLPTSPHKAFLCPESFPGVPSCAQVQQGQGTAPAGVGGRWNGCPLGLDGEPRLSLWRFKGDSGPQI